MVNVYKHTECSGFFVHYCGIKPTQTVDSAGTCTVMYFLFTGDGACAYSILPQLLIYVFISPACGIAGDVGWLVCPEIPRKLWFAMEFGTLINFKLKVIKTTVESNLQ